VAGDRHQSHTQAQRATAPRADVRTRHVSRHVVQQTVTASDHACNPTTAAVAYQLLPSSGGCCSSCCYQRNRCCCCCPLLLLLPPSLSVKLPATAAARQEPCSYPSVAPPLFLLLHTPGRTRQLVQGSLEAMCPPSLLPLPCAAGCSFAQAGPAPATGQHPGWQT
jgi:hypothetical protein